MGFIGEAWSWLTGKAGSGNSGSSTNSTSTPKPSPTLSPAPVYQSTPTNKQQVQQSFQQSVYSGGSGGGYTPPLTGGSSGGSSKTNSPSSPSLITQSTPSNKVQVQQQLRNVGAVNAATQKAQNYINTQLGSIMNLGQLSDVAYSNVVNPIYNRANQIYQNELKKYYRSQGGLTPAQEAAKQSLLSQLNNQGPKGTTGTISAYKPSAGTIVDAVGLTKLNQWINKNRDIIRSQKIRSSTGNTSPLGESELMGLAVLGTITNTLSGVIQTPKALVNLLPSLIKSPLGTGKTILNEGLKSLKQFGTLARTSPGEATAILGTQYVLLKGTNAAMTKLSNVGSAQLTKILPKYVGKATAGSKIKIPLGNGDSVQLKVVNKIPKQSFIKQIQNAGKTITSTSSQADRLVGLLKPSRVVRKPIPGEASFPKGVKILLKKFDKGTITKRELNLLNNVLVETEKGKVVGKGLLERSTFFSPGNEIRPSRLGITKSKTPSLMDYLTEDITFRKAKPQILVGKLEVQKFPKSLSNIVKKIKNGKTLTNAETNKLLKFQLTKSGKAKPLGFISREKEITIAPGEILKKVKKRAVTLIKGKRVPIYEVKIYKPAGKVKTLLTKARKGKATTKELKELSSRLSKETGFNYKLSSSGIKKGARYVSPYKSLAKIVGKSSRIASSSRKINTKSYKKSLNLSYSGQVKYTSRGQPYVISSSGRPQFIPKSSISASKGSLTKPKAAYSAKSSPQISRPYSASYYGNRTRSILKNRINVPSKKVALPSPASKSSGAFNVYAKSGKRFVRLNKKPLSGIDAISKGRYVVDNTTSASFKIVPTKKVKKLGKIPAYEKAYARKVDNKFRDYKIRYGRRKASEVVIEKRGYRIDTSGEKRGLTVAKYLKQQARGSVRKKPAVLRQVRPVSRRVTKSKRITATPSRKPAAYSPGRTIKRPAYMVKGSAAAKARMAQLRAMR